MLPREPVVLALPAQTFSRVREGSQERRDRGGAGERTGRQDQVAHLGNSV